MNATQTFSMAVKSVLSNKIRSLLTMLGIIIGVATVIILVASAQAEQKYSRLQLEAQGANRIGFYCYTNNSRLYDEVIDFCESQVGETLSALGKCVWAGSMTLKYRTKTMDMNNGGSAFFIDQGWAEASARHITLGRGITEADVRNQSRVCVIGDAVRKYFFGAMSPLDQKIKINGQSFTIVGVYQPLYGGKLSTEDQLVTLPLTLQRRVSQYYWEQDPELVLSGTDRDGSEKFCEEVKARFEQRFNDSNGNLYVESVNQYQDQMEQQANKESAKTAGIAAISLLVGGIGIMNIMLVTVTERTREIGIRMAIGARKRDIISQFLIESAVISCMGGLIGIFFGFIGSAIWGNMMFGSMVDLPYMPKVDTFLVMPSFGLVLGAFLFSALLGIIFGLYPANKAASMQPVDALRTQ